VDEYLLLSNGHLCSALYDHPVFGTVRVGLEA
jgi:hypothetical protein